MGASMKRESPVFGVVMGALGVSFVLVAVLLIFVAQRGGRLADDAGAPETDPSATPASSSEPVPPVSAALPAGSVAPAATTADVDAGSEPEVADAAAAPPPPVKAPAKKPIYRRPRKRR
jgi:hypothetical protein